MGSGAGDPEPDLAGWPLAGDPFEESEEQDGRAANTTETTTATTAVDDLLRIMVIWNRSGAVDGRRTTHILVIGTPVRRFLNPGDAWADTVPKTNSGWRARGEPKAHSFPAPLPVPQLLAVVRSLANRAVSPGTSG
ncbi:hypothetical protein GCM10023178_36370 [Actinomadura luteofluorescens]